MSAPLPAWEIPEVPPRGGFTAEEFLEMREIPPHSELIDGNLVFVSPQDQWHFRIISALERGLDEQAPERYEIAREMAVRMGRSQVPEPDLLVISAEAFQRAESTGPSTYYYPDDLLLAIEVESPESLERDRFVKPARYANAGIPHFWRVQRDGSSGIVHTYRLDSAAGSYHLTGRHQGFVKVEEPFAFAADLTTRRRGRTR